MSDDAETRGAAIVGMALGEAALAAMNRKGIISDDEIDFLLEGILTGLETLFPPGDPGIEKARKLAEKIANSIHELRSTSPKEKR